MESLSDTEELLYFLENETKNPLKNEKMIKINSRESTGSKFYDPTSFNNYYINYITEKIDNNDYLTDDWNQMQVVNALNVIYLDGDWIFSNTTNKEEFSEISRDLASNYLEYWIEELEKNNIKDSYYYVFIPETFPEDKGGFHIFIYTKKDIGKDDRSKFYDEVRTNCSEFILNNYKSHILAKNLMDSYTLYEDNCYNKLFDIGPIISLQSLLPFSQKSRTSRHYILTDISSPNIFKKDIKYLINGIKHNAFNSGVNLFSSISLEKDEPHIDEDPIIEELFNELNSEKEQKFSQYGKVAKITANFMESLRYLSKNHPFWKLLADNELRLKKIITPFLKFICVNIFIENYGELPDNNNDKFVKMVTKLFIPLLKMTTIGESTQRSTFKSCFDHIKSYYEKYSGVKQMFGSEYGKAWKEYTIEGESPKKKSKKKTEEDNTEIPDNDNQADFIRKKKAIGSIKYNFHKCYAAWTEFITKIIMDGITDEIRPFNKSELGREESEFDEVLPIPANCGGNDNGRYRFLEESFYIKTLKKWAQMFLFVTYYNSNSINEAIRAVLTAFARYFIWEKRDSDGEPVLFIYNIRQTKELERYPYNQWLIDTPEGTNRTKASGIQTKMWFKSLYLNILKPELMMDGNIRGLMILLQNLMRGGIPINNFERDAKPLKNFDSDIDNMFNNIISSFTQERNIPPAELDPVSSNFLPMRNGFLEFDMVTGETKFHENNYERFMRGCTNIMYEKEYDFNNPIYKRCVKMWEEIYPIKEERDYVQKLFSSTLHGIGLRDQLVELYGSGAEGKSMICNAITAMLGSESLGRTGYQNVKDKRGKMYTMTLENPCGLATSMKTETLLVSQSKGHDESGIIQLKDKRFCSLQEPDVELSKGKFNDSIIKNITSGSPATGRHLYGRMKAFTINALIVIQTNTMMAYSEDTDAMRRRMCVICHRSKFQTEANKERTQALTYVFKADPALNTEIANNPLYWQALFYVLLPYAQQIIKEKMIPISGIPKPISIMKSTLDSFSSSNGLIGWLNSRIYVNPKSILQISELTTVIINKHNAEKDLSILSDFRSGKWKTEIHSQLLGSYMGSVYKLISKYISRENKRSPPKVKSSLVDTIRKEFEETENLDNVKEKYFGNFAISNFSFSEMKSTFEDLFIVGYGYYDEDEELFSKF